MHFMPVNMPECITKRRIVRIACTAKGFIMKSKLVGNFCMSWVARLLDVRVDVRVAYNGVLTENVPLATALLIVPFLVTRRRNRTTIATATDADSRPPTDVEVEVVIARLRPTRTSVVWNSRVVVRLELACSHVCTDVVLDEVVREDVPSNRRNRLLPWRLDWIRGVQRPRVVPCKSTVSAPVYVWRFPSRVTMLVSFALKPFGLWHGISFHVKDNGNMYFCWISYYVSCSIES
jgi:hypothetical protein